MTCAAPRDKGRMGCCYPDGEAGGVGCVCGSGGGVLQEAGRERVES